MQAGDLRDRVSFGSLQPAGGEGGNFRAGPYIPEFTVWANIRPVNAGEEVMAGRVSGTRTILVTVRSLRRTRAITAEMCCRDERTQEAFDIVEAKDPDGRRQWVEILARSGTAGGGVAGEQQA